MASWAAGGANSVSWSRSSGRFDHRRSVLVDRTVVAVKYETALGRQEGVMQAKEILIHALKGIALAALAPALVALVKWVLGSAGLCGF